MAISWRSEVIKMDEYHNVKLSHDSAHYSLHIVYKSLRKLYHYGWFETLTDMEKDEFNSMFILLQNIVLAEWTNTIE